MDRQQRDTSLREATPSMQRLVTFFFKTKDQFGVFSRGESASIFACVLRRILNLQLCGGAEKSLRAALLGRSGSRSMS